MKGWCHHQSEIEKKSVKRSLKSREAFFYEKQADVLMKSACVVCVLLLYLFLASYSKKEMKRGVEEENNNKSSN